MKRVLRRMIMPSSEVRMDGATGKITGYAAVFDTPTELWPGLQEVVRPGAFSKTLRESDVRALFNHDPNHVLGRNTAGTLRLWEDPKGLGYEIDPPDTEFARGLMESLKRGDISQSSFGFWVIKERRLEDNAAGVTTRELLEVELQDVSPVTYPAYEETQAMVRSAEMEMGVTSPPAPPLKGRGEEDVLNRGTQTEEQPEKRAENGPAMRTAEDLRKRIDRMLAEQDLRDRQAQLSALGV